MDDYQHLRESADAAATLTLAERFDPRPVDDARYEAAIARRNTTWAAWQTARKRLDAARELDRQNDFGVRHTDAHIWVLVGACNEALRDYEWAKTDLIRERVRWEREGVPW